MTLLHPSSLSISRRCLRTDVDLCCIFVGVELCAEAPAEHGQGEIGLRKINLQLNVSRATGPNSASIAVRLLAVLTDRIWTVVTFLRYSVSLRHREENTAVHQPAQHFPIVCEDSHSKSRSSGV